MNRRKHIASHINRMNFFERKFTPSVYKALQSQIKLFIADMKANGISHATRELDNIIINGEVLTAVSKIYKVVGVYFANDTYRQIQEQVPTKGFGFNQEWIDEIVNFFRLYLLNQAVVPISETTKNQIRQILIIGEKNGWGVDKIAYELAHSELTLMRARMIVRTESNKAMFKGREMAKEKSPYKLTSEWIAAHDARTRHSHKIVDGLKVEEGETFTVPVYKGELQIGTDQMIGPGDPKGHKSNLINCRCTTAERVVFDNEDNPVMKRQSVLV